MYNIDTSTLIKATRSFQRCSRCLLDTVADDSIFFDQDGICSYCHQYELYVRPKFLTPDVKNKKFKSSLGKIKEAGRHRKYDCIMGLSGGMDSSYVAYIAMKEGLRPLIVHLDNGWDSELAVKNIENIIQKTGFDYYNYVIDWDEFKDMQLSYLKASVIDVEVVTDQAIFALLHIIANKLNIPHILFGDNPLSERTMPNGWTYKKNDLANMNAIHSRYGTMKMNSYPFMGQYNQEYYSRIKCIRYVRIMHYVDKSISEISKVLESEFGWNDYKWKHCESIFTQFYQGYILPKKFGVDKRKAHLSDLILSGQISREEGFERLNQPYYHEGELEKDYDYVLRKFEMTNQEFEELINLKPVPHRHFPTDQKSLTDELKLRLWSKLHLLKRFFRKVFRLCLGRTLWQKLNIRLIKYLESKIDSDLKV